MPKIEPREPDELLAAARAGERDGFTALVRLHQAREDQVDSVNRKDIC